jgi:membrane protease subunit HflC
VKSRLSHAVAVVLVLVLALELLAFQVRETERAVVLTFGEATREIKEPGLYAKWPWPVEQVVRFDARLRVLEGPLEECQTEDGKALLVSSFIIWRVDDPLGFLKSLGTVEQGERALERDVRDAQAKAVGRFAWGALVAAQRERHPRDEVETAIRDEHVARVARQYRAGIAVELAGIRRLALPEATRERVFERMKAEREARAAEILAQGEADAAALKADAERERLQALDQAKADERRLLAEAEKAAAEHFAVFGQDQDLAIFLRKLEALKRVLAKRSTIVLDTKAPPFDLLAPDGAAIGSQSKGTK